MKANELQINNFLQAPNVQFVIPVYQRNYDWTNTECKDILNDIISVETEGYVGIACCTWAIGQFFDKKSRLIIIIIKNLLNRPKK